MPKLNLFKITLYNSALLSTLLGNQEGAWVRMHLLSTGTPACAETPGVLVHSQVALGCGRIPWMPLNTNLSANSRAVFGHRLLWADWGCCTILNLCETNLDIFASVVWFSYSIHTLPSVTWVHCEGKSKSWHLKVNCKFWWVVEVKARVCVCVRSGEDTAILGVEST